MAIEKLLYKINLFCKYAKASDEEILKKLSSSFETFKDRIDYAEENLDHMSSGTSRIVYRMHDGSVLKLAKNERGVAQNKVEGNPKLISKFINKTLKRDPNGLWKTSPFLEKITEKEFEKLTNINFKDFGQSLEYGLQDISKDKIEKPKNFENISKSEIYKDLDKVCRKFTLLPGDLARISSWLSDGKIPKVCDCGLTLDIFQEFYSDEEKKKYKSKKSKRET